MNIEYVYDSSSGPELWKRQLKLAVAKKHILQHEQLISS